MNHQCFINAWERYLAATVGALLAATTSGEAFIGLAQILLLPAQCSRFAFAAARHGTLPLLPPLKLQQASSDQMADNSRQAAVHPTSLKTHAPSLQQSSPACP